MKTAEPKAAANKHDSKKSTNSFFNEDGVLVSDSQPDIQPFFNAAGSPQENRTPFFNSTRIQTKLTVGKPNDKYEQEADSVADTVVQKLSQPDSKTDNAVADSPSVQLKAVPVSIQKNPSVEENTETQELEESDEAIQKKPIFESSAPPEDQESVQKKCDNCESEEDTVQQKSNGSGIIQTNLEDRLGASSGNGSALPKNVQTDMGGAMGADFSNVRVHTGSEATQLNKELGAQAFTHGNDIYFNEGKYQPESSSGKHLLAHELTHTVQQGASSSINKKVQKNSSSPNVQRGVLDTLSAGASWVGDRASGAWDATKDAVGGVVQQGADFFMGIVRRYAPNIATLISNGPGGLIKSAFKSGIGSWIGGLFGGFDIGATVENLKTNLSSAIATIKTIMGGGDAGCAAFNNAMDGLRSFMDSISNNPAVLAVKQAFSSVASTLGRVRDLVLAPVFDTLMSIAGGVFNGVKKIAQTIWDWGAPVRSFLSKAWNWVLEKLGIRGDGEGGIWNWIKDKASAIWNTIKETLKPVLGPIKSVISVLIMFSPAGPFILVAKYGPKIIRAVKWLWANRSNPNIVKSAHKEMKGTILPSLLSGVQGFAQAFQSAVGTFTNQLIQIGSSVINFIGGLIGVPLLNIMTGVVRTISNGIKKFIGWAQGALNSAVSAVMSVFKKVYAFVSPFIEVLSSIALAIINPGMIPIIIAGWAWRKLPDCYKPAIINFILDIVIGFLRSIPTLALFGPLWAILKPGVIGFLEAVRAKDDNTKIAVSNKFAKIISGASLDFILGFVIGLLKGIWEGLTDPFVLLYQAVSGIGNLILWLMGESGGSDSNSSSATNTLTSANAGTVSSPTAQPAVSTNNSDRVSPETQASVSARMYSMGTELEPDATIVGQNLMPAVQEHFQNSEGMTYEQLTKSLGEAWSSAETAIKGAGASLANKAIEFLMQGSAERKIGESVGWLAGTIIFEVALAILTAGTYTAANGAMKVLQTFAKILDWTGEVLGLAFKALAKVGGYIMDIVKGIGKMLNNAGGAIGKVMSSLKSLGQKFIKFAGELLGLVKKSGAADNVAGKGAKEVAETAAERTAKEAAEETGEKAAKEVAGETAEEAGEKAAKESAQEGGEKTAKEGVDDATKAAERPAAVAAATSITNTMDAAPYSPIPSLLAALNTLKTRFRWIKRFEARPKGIGRYSVHLIASDITIDNNYTESNGNSIDNPTRRQQNFNDQINKRADITPEEAQILRDYNNLNPSGTRSVDDVLKDVRNPDLSLNPETGRFLDPDRARALSKRQQYMGATPSKQSSVGQQVKDRMKGEGRLRENPITGKEEVYGPIRKPDGTVENGWFDLEDADMGHHPIDAVDFWNKGDPSKGLSPGRELGPRHSDIRDWMKDPNNYEFQHYGYNRSMGGSTTSRYQPPVE